MTASFEVCGWTLDAARHELRLAYTLDHPELGRHHMVERVELPVTVPNPAGDAFARAATLLLVAAGVSYFKAAAPDTVSFGAGVALTQAGRDAMSALYDDGLRECALANGLALPRPIAFPDPRDVGPGEPAPSTTVGPALVPIGAGRDSTLLASLLAAAPVPPPRLLAIGDNPYAPRIAATTGLELLVARRHLDPKLLALNAAGAMNGHVPVTAINSLVAVVVACATGCSSVVMANERSASQPTRVVDGVEVNHQYSKSVAFERLLRAALVPCAVEYYSALRPWGELPIADAFAAADPMLHRAFMSCNRAFVRDPAARSDGWCGNCPKCRSVFLSLAPFMTPQQLTDVFGSDLLADPDQVAGFVALVQPEAKPFECVGEIDEARTAVAMLASEGPWVHHAVVRALAATSPAPATTVAFDRSDDHEVPSEVLAHLATAIDPGTEVLERVRRALIGVG